MRERYQRPEVKASGQNGNSATAIAASGRLLNTLVFGNFRCHIYGSLDLRDLEASPPIFHPLRESSLSRRSQSYLLKMSVHRSKHLAKEILGIMRFVSNCDSDGLSRLALFVLSGPDSCHDWQNLIKQLSKETITGGTSLHFRTAGKTTLAET